MLGRRAGRRSHERARPAGNAARAAAGTAARRSVAGMQTFYEPRRRVPRTRLRRCSLAFLIGGLVVAVTGRASHAALRLQGDLRRHRASTGSSIPGGDQRRGGRATSSRPADHDAADPDRPRGRVRVPLRHVQHRRPGPVLGRPALARSGRAALRGLPRARLTSPRPRRGDRSAARSGAASPGVLKATVGAHEVISTIMLNWIAIWVGKWLFELGGPLQGADRACRAPTTSSTRRGSRRSGDGLQPLHIGHLHRALRARRLPPPAQPDDARLRGPRGRLQPGGGPLRRHLGGRELLPRARHLGRLRRPRGRHGHAGLEVPGRRARRPTRRRLHRHRRRAAGAEQRGRHPLRGPALRRAHGRHLAAPARPRACSTAELATTSPRSSRR